ncbi:surface carbohydrate biosynthesis protein [Dongia sp.]|uniref:surface carbohydrate biosynthesis protein n=1 Tax=Dongia sp. TaxID=1977262 RepID=UPI0037502F9E
MNRILYLPMEIASRELDSRLLLSVIALTYGFEVVIGQKWLIESNIRRMPGGVYLSKTMTRRDAESLAKARARGYFPAAIDEEMPGLVTKPEELRWIAPEAVEQSEAIFIAGEGNTQSFMARFPAAKAKVHMALNPRWDLLRSTFRSLFDEEVGRIRDAYGDFILVNTNQGFTNSEKGSKDDILREQVRLGKIDPANTEHMAYVNSIVEMEDANKAAILKVVGGLRQAHPDRTLVIRPHPSERIATWTEAFPGDARIKVVREGSAVPWILASTLLVHTNCTTGTEAIALGKPAICVMPLDNAICQRYLSNRVNPVARSVEEALALAERILSGGVANLYTPQMIDTFHHAMSFEDDRLGAQIIIEQLVNAVERREPLNAPGSASSWRPDQNYRWHIPDKNVRAELFPSLDREAVVRRLQKIAMALGIDLMPEVEYCGSKVLLISNHRMAPFVRFRRSLAGAFYDFRTGT